jgi:hypothetical protein
MSYRSPTDFSKIAEDSPRSSRLQTARRDFGMRDASSYEGPATGGGRMNYEKYSVYGFTAAFALLLIVAYYLKEETRHRRNMDYASLTFLGLAALAAGYKGLYKAYDKKNIYTLFSVVAGLLFLAQAYYVYEARDDIDGTLSMEQERSTMITYGGAVAGLIGGGYLIYKSRQ